MYNLAKNTFPLLPQDLTYTEYQFMLKTPIIHPPILKALGQSGHLAQVVIADGNLPVGAMQGPNAKLVHLNFRPGILNALQVLDGILEVCPVQGATVMQKPPEANAEIHDEYRARLGNVTWDELERYAFYDKIRDQATTLLIATGEQRRFANLILTIGVVTMAEESHF